MFSRHCYWLFKNTKTNNKQILCVAGFTKTDKKKKEKTPNIKLKFDTVKTAHSLIFQFHNNNTTLN